MPVAAAIKIAFSFQLARNYQDEEFYFDLAREIAMRHNVYHDFDVRAASFSDVQAGLKNLALSVTLYWATMSGSLCSLKSIDRHVGLEANEVDIWEDSDRLFALVD